MNHPTFELSSTPGGDPLLIFREALNYDKIRSVWDEALHFLNEKRPKRLSVDFSNVTVFDSAGIAFFRALERYCRQHAIELNYGSIPPSMQQFLDHAEADVHESKPSDARPHWDYITHLGEQTLVKLRDSHDLIQFIGSFFVASLKMLTNLKRYRWREMIYYLQLSGSEALPILGLLNFLMGMVIAFQAAIQLRQFGANIFVADLVSLSITRELGPLLTAIVLTGRSGSAFAAEIGTMKINEEVDALSVMGFDTMDFLVIPKIHSLAIAGPLLTLFADLVGILGGAVVGIIGLDLTFGSYIEEAVEAIAFQDVLSGLIKSFVFAMLISLIGCFRGLQTGNDADSVGRQTTSAVVSGLFLIILADSIFTVLFHIFNF